MSSRSARRPHAEQACSYCQIQLRHTKLLLLAWILLLSSSLLQGVHGGYPYHTIAENGTITFPNLDEDIPEGEVYKPRFVHDKECKGKTPKECQQHDKNEMIKENRRLQTRQVTILEI